MSPHMHELFFFKGQTLVSSGMFNRWIPPFDMAVTPESREPKINYVSTLWGQNIQITILMSSVVPSDED